MELLAILALCLILFLLIGVPWLALASRSEARAATRQVELLVGQIALLQRQIDQLRAGAPAAAEAPGPPQPADEPAEAVAAATVPSERPSTKQSRPRLRRGPRPFPRRFPPRRRPCRLPPHPLRHATSRS